MKKKKPQVLRVSGNFKHTQEPDRRRILLIFGSTILAGIVLAFFIINGTGSGPKLSPRDQVLIEKYERVRIALALDNLQAAKQAASDLAGYFKDQKTIAGGAEALIKADSLEAARYAFKVISGDVVKIARGHRDCYVMCCPSNCPRVFFGEWVQTYPVIENPFMGKEMMHCGMIKP